MATTENPERLGAALNGPMQIVNTTAVAVLDRFQGPEGRPRAPPDLVLDKVSVKLEIVEQ